MTTPFHPGPLAEVSCHADGERWTLVFVRDLAHPPARVWAALTEPDRLAAWAPFDAERDLASPGDTTLHMRDGDTSVPMPASVLRVEPPTLLEYAWGDDLLRWELAATPGGTRLTLRHTVDDPATGPKAAAGWHLCLAVADRALAGDPVGRIVGRDAMDHGWQELHDAYAGRLGATAER
jgi:uncharacterized protein YndB with AHSA1/START domain